MFTQSWLGRCWQLGLATLAIVGTVTGVGDCAIAQLAPDSTLGAEPSVVTPNVVINGVPSDRIDGGAIRGSNLFHSFLELNVSEGRGVYFTNPAGIQNILSRVTGNNPSNIFGKIGVLGNANLFLINPNGIVFGPNATLDVSGSFVGSTASSLNFADGTQFSATAPQTTPLLTISVPIGLQFGGKPGSILNQSQATDSSGNTAGLQVQPDKTLALVGGDVALAGGSLTAPGGRIELGSVTGNSLVNLTSIDKGWALGYKGVQNFQDIQMSQEASIDASGEGGGDIQVQGRQVTLTDGSQIYTNTQGAGQGGTLTVNASDSLELIGTTPDGKFPSGLFANVNQKAVGSGGNLTINTGRLSVRDGAEVSVTTFGAGNAGNLTVYAPASVELSGEGPKYPGGLFAQVDTTGTGHGGNLTIDTGHLSVSNGSKVQVSTFGQGDAGDLLIRAPEIYVIDTSTFYNAGIFAEVARSDARGNGGNLTIRAGQLTISGNFARISVDTQGNGQAGILTIDTGRLSVSDGAQVSASTFGSGNAGSLTVKASDSVELSGEGKFPSGLFAQVDTAGTGRGGNLTIDTGRLSISDGSEVQASTFGFGDAGNLFIRAPEVEVIDTPTSFYSTGIFAEVGRGNARGAGGNLTIEAGRLSIQNGAQVSASTYGEGNAGSLTIKASDVELSGTTPNGKFPSSLFANVNQGAVGSGGNLAINTGRLSVRDGAQVSTTTFGVGNAGNLTVYASNSVELSGEGSKYPGGLFAQVDTTGTGRGGNLIIDTGRLSVSDGSKVEVSTFGQGDAGSLLIRTPEVDVFETPTYNSNTTGIFAEVGRSNAKGAGGNLTIEAGRLSIQDGAQVSASTYGEGNAGNLLVQAKESVEVVGTTAKFGPLSRSLLVANVNQGARGAGGNLTIETGNLSVRDGGQVSVSTFGEGNAGTLQVNANESVEVVGTSPDSRLPSELSAAVGPNSTGSGGSLNVEAGQLSIRDGATLTSRSEGQSSAGNIAINVRDTLQANNGEISTSSTKAGGGNINLAARDIRLRNSSLISTSVLDSTGGGGDIRIGSDRLIALEDSDILANAKFGNGGNIRIISPVFLANLFGNGQATALARNSGDFSEFRGNGRVDISASSQFGISGNVTIPNFNLLQNSLTQLPTNLIDTNRLIANSCIARSNRKEGSFIITGAGGLPTRPRDASVSPYPTGIVRSIPSEGAFSNSPNSSVSATQLAHPWQLGNPIVEPQGVYRLSNGQLVLSRECSQ